MDEPAQDACPTPDVLAAFASGGLSDDDLSRIAAHLEHCPACVKALSGGDPFTQHLQRIHQEGVNPWAETETMLSARMESTPYFFDMAGPPSTKDAERFFNALAQSRLIDDDEMKLVRREWKAFRSADLTAFTESLVVQGRLTDFHVRQLLRGKSLGWLLNDYIVLHPAPAASKAWVYTAFHSRHKRTFTLKIAPPHLVPPAATIKRFRHDIDVIAKLRHPRLAPAVDVGEAVGVSYVATEELPGHSLAEWVELNGPMRVLSAVDMIREACEGIAAAHEAGVIHGELKPSNLWIETFVGTGRGSHFGPGLKVLDFGASRLHAAEARKLTESGRSAPLATLGFTAPEVSIAGQAADVRSDVFSLGCCLYFLLTGKPPYVGEYPKAGAAPAEMPALESPREPVPRALETVYRRMVAVSAKERYESVDDLIVDLDAVLSGARVGSPRMGRLFRGAGIAAVAAGLVAAIWFSVAMLTPPPTPGGNSHVLKLRGPAPKPLDGPATAEAVAAAQKEWAAALGIPIEITNKLGMKLRLVPPGTMTLGTPPGEIDARLAQLVPGGWQWQSLRRSGDLELPPHKVTLTQPFYMGTTEVTLAQFRAFQQAVKKPTTAENDGLGGVSYASMLRRRSPNFTWKTPGYEIEDNGPVTQVTAEDALEFCKWLSDRDGRTYSLPTESQWEFACRAGRGERWFWGGDADLARDFAAVPREDHYGPAPAARAKANALGLFDMSGNVAEWCADRFDPDYTPPSALTDPAPRPAAGHHLARGGSFRDLIPDGIASATRIDPPDACQDFVGFRVMLGLTIER
jgi:formylglycine-generating enzyme required for sulfatase activity